VLPQPAVTIDRRRRRFALTRRASGALVGVALAIGLVFVASRAWPSLSIALFGSSSTVRDGQLALSIELPTRSFRANERIPITSSVTYLGPSDVVTMSSEYDDALYFSLEQIDGPLDMDGDGSRLVCYDSTLRRGVAVTVPFAKSGGFDPAASDGPFWSAYFGDLENLRLPAGRWRIGAHLRAAIATHCPNDDHALDTSVSFTVSP
jgi:hypothetical protein